MNIRALKIDYTLRLLIFCNISALKPTHNSATVQVDDAEAKHPGSHSPPIARSAEHSANIGFAT
jgi:hypothetical protein